MYNVAIVDDNKTDANRLLDCVNEYFLKTKQEFKVQVFNSSVDFVERFTPIYDLIFLDVEMSVLNGIEVAKEIRFKDETVCIVFVTGFSKYAVKGYEVQAFDYFVKPLEYDSFSYKMERIIRKINSVNKSKSVYLPTEDGTVKVFTRDVCFVEVKGHYSYYHTAKGDYKVRQTMKSVEKTLNDDFFIRCNVCYLVNMKHITRVRTDEITVANQVVRISRAKKKGCMEILANYFGREKL